MEDGSHYEVRRLPCRPLSESDRWTHCSRVTRYKIRDVGHMPNECTFTLALLAQVSTYPLSPYYRSGSTAHPMNEKPTPPLRVYRGLATVRGRARTSGIFRAAPDSHPVIRPEFASKNATARRQTRFDSKRPPHR